MASPDEAWNAAAICQALGCRGCLDCREDDSDATWDGKDEDHDRFWACPKPGDCPAHEIPMVEIGADGFEVTT